MKKLLAVVLLCLPVFGQAVYSGAGYSSGPAIFSVASSGAPLTYNARTDTCVTGSESGCMGGRTTGQAGSALVFQEGTSDPVPFKRLDDATTPAVMNTSFTDPDFETYEVFVTDQAFQTNTTVWSMGSDGGYDAFNQNGTLLTFQNSGSVSYLVDVVPSRFHSHTCSPSTPCFIKSQIHGGSGGGCTTNCTLLDNNAAIAFSRVPTDSPNTLYEGTPTSIYKLVITVPTDGNGIPTGADTFSRTLVVDFTSDTPVPCSVLPSDYVSTWNGGFSPSTGGSFAIASSGAGGWHANTVYGSDNFIDPIHNDSGMAHFMFQATTAGTSDLSTEPNWAVSCPAKGNTCTDGSVTWTNIGAGSGQGPGFDVVSYDPSTGCSRINTRLGKIYRGTGNSDPAGTMLTDDKLTCDRLGTAAPCAMLDTFTLHATSQQEDSNFATLGATGAGGANGAFPGVGSCVDSGMKFKGAWATGTNYAFHDFVYDPNDSGHNWWNVKASGGVTSTIAPHLDSTNWANDNNLCYGYIWQKHTLMVRPLIGLSTPSGVSGGGFSTDGHNVGAYQYTYRGGKYFAHLYSKPTCDDATAPCLYPGAANPGTALLPNAICNDGHPTYRNNGPLDLQPIFDPTADVPAWGGVGLSACTGSNVTNCSRYTCAGYNEELAFSTDGNQTVWRFGHNYNSGSNSGFGIQNAIGVISQQGDMLAYTTDAMNTRGDKATGSVTCEHPLRGQYLPAPSQTVTYQDSMMPVTHNGSLDIYQAVGCPNNGGTTTCTEASTVPNWDTVCPSPGDYCTSDKTVTGTIADNNVLWLNLGPNTCRGDIVVMDVLSAHAAP